MSDNILSTQELLRGASNEDLQPLVDYILNANTENLSDCPKFKQHRPNHREYADSILHEIRLFGGNTFVNLFRSEGPQYLEVLQDAAEKVGVKNTDSYDNEEDLERKMIETLLLKAMKDAEGKEKEELEEALKQAGMQAKDYRAFISGTSLTALLAPHLYRIFMQQSSILIASAVSRQLLGNGLRMGAGFAAGRAGSLLLGPVGWAVAGIWTAADIAGPAYRVTVPCTLHIAMLRQQRLANQELKEMESVFND